MLILVRHTRPLTPISPHPQQEDGEISGLFPEDVCYGATDLDLAPTFEEEAARVVAALPPVERLVTSPLRRCRRLAERIGAAQSLAPEVDERLREMDFGRWEGASWQAIPRAELDAWAADLLHARPHGGESVHMLYERAWSALADYRRTGLSHVVVTHAGVIRAARAENGDPDAWKSRVDFGGRVLLPLDRSG